MFDSTGLPCGSAVTCKIVAILWRCRVTVKIPLHISSEVALWGARKTWIPKVAGSIPRCATILFQQFSPVGIAIFTGEDPQTE